MNPRLIDRTESIRQLPRKGILRRDSHRFRWDPNPHDAQNQVHTRHGVYRKRGIPACTGSAVSLSKSGRRNDPDPSPGDGNRACGGDHIRYPGAAAQEAAVPSGCSRERILCRSFRTGTRNLLRPGANPHPCLHRKSCYQTLDPSRHPLLQHGIPSI